MNDKEVLDVSVLNQLADETSAEALPRLINLYTIELAETLDDLSQYFSTDSELFKKTLHKAKSSSATFGAKKFNCYLIEAEEQLLMGKQVEKTDFQVLLSIGKETLNMIKRMLPKEKKYV